MKFYRLGDRNARILAGRGLTEEEQVFNRLAGLTRNLTGGTCFQGDFEAKYNEIVEVFGKPTSAGDGYKMDVCWELMFEDGTVATIYDWKSGKNYNGREGISAKRNTFWHIGGHSEEAVKRVFEELKIGTG